MLATKSNTQGGMRYSEVLGFEGLDAAEAVKHSTSNSSLIKDVSHYKM